MLYGQKMKSDAVISPCGKYRYALWRIWDETLPLAFFIGLNPSTADAIRDDNTIRRCVSFAQQLGYGGLSMGNLFALRSTNPKKLFEASDPTGPDNDKWLTVLKAKANIAIAAWGNNGTYLGRDQMVAKMFSDLYCLKLSTKGIPCHPLYLSSKLKPMKITSVRV